MNEFTYNTYVNCCDTIVTVDMYSFNPKNWNRIVIWYTVESEFSYKLMWNEALPMLVTYLFKLIV